MGKFFTPQKISLFLAVSFFLTVVLARNVWGAYTTGGTDEYGQALQETNINLEQFSLYNISFTGRGLTKSLVGYPATPGQTSSGGALAVLTGLTANMLIYKPASGVQYLADLGKNWGLPRPAYAQNETGYVSLNAVQALWQITRNLSYLAFVLIFVVIGFMIMLRTRIDPRTVATVQAAIPGVVVALILVTFSYAIAGLIIDITNLSTYLAGNIFQTAGIANNMGGLINQIQHSKDYNIFVLFEDLLNGGAQAQGANVVKSIVEALNNGLIDFIRSIPGTDQIADWILGLFFALLIVMIMFRVFIMLLTALVTIVLLTIAAPFQFLAAAIPGRGSAIFGWFKNMFAAALTFPLTFIMLILAAAFLGIGQPPFNGVQPLGCFTWVPVPLGVIGDSNRCTGVGFLNELIGIGIILFMPKVNDMIKAAFEVKTSPWSGAPGEAIGGGLAAIRKVLPI